MIGKNVRLHIAGVFHIDHPPIQLILNAAVVFIHQLILDIRALIVAVDHHLLADDLLVLLTAVHPLNLQLRSVITLIIDLGCFSARTLRRRTRRRRAVLPISRRLILRRRQHTIHQVTTIATRRHIRPITFLIVKILIHYL